MSKDIRSFFKPKSNPKPTVVVNLSDDDVIPESPEVQNKTKKKKSTKRRVVQDSSDEETCDKKSKQTNSKTSIKEKTTAKGKNENSKGSNLKEVKASDMFGSVPIKRTDPIVMKEKKTSKTEIGIHFDDEFDKSLLELDEANIVDNSETKISPQKENSSVVINNQQSSVQSEYFGENKEKSNKKAEVSVKKLDNENNEASSHKHNNITEISSQNVVISKDKAVKEIKEKVRNEKKRDFAEFIDDGAGNHINVSDGDEEGSSKNKKRKINKSLNESVISDEERYEKKRYSAIAYQNYLNRSGPKHLGSKVIPEGKPHCLKDLAFVVTGVLDSFEREEIAEAVTKYGGTMKSGISKKVTHVLAGEDAGQAKLAKAQDLNIKIITEDEFIQLIIDNSKSGESKHDSREKSKKHDIVKKDKDNKSSKKTETKTRVETPVTKKSEVAVDKMKEIEKKIQQNFYSKNKSVKEPVAEVSEMNEIKIENDNKTLQKTENNLMPRSVDFNAQMWVEKYKPQTVKQIIGQHGDASNVKKLTNWLTKWYISRKEKIPKPSPWAKNDTGAYFKAALLSGPPGVGKTTTVSLVCKELGFDMVEFNASDTRSKTLIKEQISELLTTSSLTGFATNDKSKKAVTKKHVLVMDEVDGMAGNEDRGGLQELISLIKLSAVPIICMCNDRNSQKMRTLVNYCYDLKFSKPRVDQIKSAMMSVCFKEGVKIQPEALTQLIMASNQDVRQTLNLLSMWSINSNQMNSEQVKKDANSAKKDIKLGPWEAVRKVFSADEHKTMSIHDKSDLFFYDYSLAPLFVQENYLQVAPHCPKNEILKRFSIASDSISAGDLVESKIRGQGAWNLLPVQAMYSSVIPGHALSGHVAGQIQFPGWLGKNSRKNKMHRLCQEIHAHTRLSTSGSKSSIYLDYSSHLRDAIVGPLIKDKAEGIPQTVEVLQTYNLLREDLDSLIELSLWPGQRDPTVLIDSKVKAAMTRTYNKESTSLPYAAGSVKRRAHRDDESDDFNSEPLEAEASDSDPENDALIMKKKKEKPAKTISDSEKPSTSKVKKGKTQKKS